MKTTMRNLIIKLFISFFFLFTIHISLSTEVSYAEVIDRVVAIVDDDVVMLSELDSEFQRAQMSDMEVTREEVLDGMINRILLLREAKKVKKTHIFSARKKNEDNILISDYIEKRVKAFIRIPFDEIEIFYNENKSYFNGSDIYKVRDEIEAYLIELEVNKKLIAHLDELRQKAYVRKQY